MTKLLALFRSRLRDDSGLSLIEILVAMMVFAFMSVGIAAGMVATLRMTDDARDRTAAANIAAAAIDTARVADVLLLEGETRSTTVVDDTTFEVTTNGEWVVADASTVSSSCATGEGARKYMRVIVTVTWAGARAGGVTSHTQIAPPGLFTDSGNGAINVYVTGPAVGAGSDEVARKGVRLEVDPVRDGMGTLLPTNAAGCSYISNLLPGSYIVSLVNDAGSSYIDENQVTPVSKLVTVSESSNAQVFFNVESAAIFTPRYAFSPRAFSGAPLNAVLNGRSFQINPSTPTPLYPDQGAGYRFYFGTESTDATDDVDAQTCDAVNPAFWSDPRIGADGKQYEAGDYPVAVGSTVSPEPSVRAGAFTLVGVGANTAVVATMLRENTDVAGYPGCDIPTSYSFNAGTSGNNIVLPYGSWAITVGGAAPNVDKVKPSGDAFGTVSSVGPSTVLTLDPRLKEAGS